MKCKNALLGFVLTITSISFSDFALAAPVGVSGGYTVADMNSQGEVLLLGNTIEPTVTAYFNKVTDTRFTTSGFRLLMEEKINGEWQAPEDFVIKGVCWNPAKKNVDNVVDFHEAVYIDGPLMKDAHINTVRTYSIFPMNDQGIAILDELHRNNIKVAMTVYGDLSHVWYLDAVKFFKGHPAILTWIVGNEFNYSRLGTAYGTHKQDPPYSMDKVNGIVNSVIAEIQAEDPNHPVSASWGYFNGSGDFYNYVNGLTNADMMAYNAYGRLSWTNAVEWEGGVSFNMFAEHKSFLTRKIPMWVSEYGADSWNNDIPGVDLGSQAVAVRTLTEVLRDNLAATNAGEASTIGGTIFEWTDEWWKVWHEGGSIYTQDPGGFDAGGNAPYPDEFFNEEYFGILDIDRNPKPAFFALKEVYSTYFVRGE